MPDIPHLSASVAADTCYGLREIACELFGDDSRRNQRRTERLIYEVPEHQRIETFLWAGVRCARRSRLRRHVAALAGEEVAP